MRKSQSVNPEPILVQAANDPLPPLTAEEVVAIEARACERRDYCYWPSSCCLGSCRTASSDVYSQALVVKIRHSGTRGKARIP